MKTNYGEILRERRKSLKLTQTDAAKKGKVLQSFISKLEAGNRQIKIADFPLIKKIYKLDLQLNIVEMNDDRS